MTPSVVAALPPALRPETCTVGVLGATGGQGRGLAYRFARAGMRVVIGSRSPARAAAAADEILPEGRGSRGAENLDCAAASDIVVVAVPFSAQEEILTRLRPVLDGKIVVTCANPLGFDEHGAYAVTVPEGSAALQAARLLPRSLVVAAFHHVSSTLLLNASNERMPSLDIMVVGDHYAACARVQQLVDIVPGLRGVYAGGLRNAHQLEALSATLITLSRHHQSYTGVTIHGVQQDTA